jgi:hypothetical protein
MQLFYKSSLLGSELLYGELSHKVQRAVEERTGWPGIKTQPGIPHHREKARLLQFLGPLRTPPVVEGKGHSMTRVSHPIQKTQRRESEESFSGVIFDHYALGGDAASFAQELSGIVSVVQDVHEQDGIKRLVRKRESATVVGRHLDARFAPKQNFRAFEMQVGTQPQNRLADLAVPTSHVENAGLLGQEWRHVGCQNPYPAWSYVALMNEIGEVGHIPRIYHYALALGRPRCNLDRGPQSCGRPVQTLAILRDVLAGNARRAKPNVGAPPRQPAGVR